MDTPSGIVSGTAAVYLWLVAGATALLTLVTLLTQPSPNHSFFLQLLERLGEVTPGDDHED